MVGILLSMAKGKKTKDRKLMKDGGIAAALGGTGAAISHQQEKKNLRSADELTQLSKNYSKALRQTAKLNAELRPGPHGPPVFKEGPGVDGFHYSYHYAKQAADHKNLAKFNRTTKHAGLAAAGIGGAAMVGGAFYNRYRKNKLERVRKPSRSRNGR